MAEKYSKWLSNIPTFSIPRPSKIYPYWDFGLKINHLATLAQLTEDNKCLSQVNVVDFLRKVCGLDLSEAEIFWVIGILRTNAFYIDDPQVATELPGPNPTKHNIPKFSHICKIILLV
jgi:hypothetical protein